MKSQIADNIALHSVDALPNRIRDQFLPGGTNLCPIHYAGKSPPGNYGLR